jgi:hypothetical protein
MARINGHGAEGTPGLDGFRTTLAARLQTRRLELEEAIFARFRDTGYDPALGEDTEYIAGARAAVAEAVEFGLEAIEHGDDRQSAIPPAAVAQSRRAARNSVSLERVLLRNNAGHALLGDFVMQEAEHSDLSNNRNELRDVLKTLAEMLDQFTASIANEYQHELQRMSHSPELRRIECVQRLLAGAPADASDLDYDFDAEHVAVIGLGAGAREAITAAAARLGRELLCVSRSDETVWAWYGGKRAPALDELERVLSEKQPAGVSVVLGTPAPGIHGWRLTHRQAQAASLVALRKPQKVTRYADVALLAAVLKDTDLAQSLVDVYLSPLATQKDWTTSQETLTAYFAAGCNAATAAVAIGVDRHTVERRLHAVETRLGRLLRECQAELEVALELVRLGVCEPPTQPSLAA